MTVIFWKTITRGTQNNYMTNFFKGSGQGIVNATYSKQYVKTTRALKPEQADEEMGVIGYTGKAVFSQHLHGLILHGKQQTICD